MEEENKSIFNFHRLDIVYSNKISVYIVSFGCAIFFTYNYYKPSLILQHTSWLLVFLFYMTLRVFSSMFYSYFKTASEYSYRFFENINICISIFGGLIWGISAHFFLQNAQAQDLLVAVTIYAGICSGAIGANAASIRSNLAFCYTLLGTAMLSFTTLDGNFKYSLISIFAIFAVGITSSIRIVFQSIVKNIELRLEKESLLENLESANNARIYGEREALQSAKMASIGEMASGMAHEINNPLTIIKGNLALMKRRSVALNDNNEDELINKTFMKCSDNIQRIVKTIESLKQMSTNNADEKTSMSKVSELVKSAIGFIHEKLKCSNIQLIQDIENSNTIINCNSISTSQSLLGLITNAYHLSSAKTFSWIKIRSYNDENYNYFEVSSSEVDTEFLELSKALLNQVYTLGDKSRIYNITSCQTAARKNGGDIYFKSADNKSALVLKVPLNLPSKLDKVA